jgi:hypothetical protein
MTIRVGDTYLSPTWAVVIGGAAVDLTDGWTVRAQARTKAGALVVDFTTLGSVLFGTADVEVGEDTVSTSTIRLYLPPSVTIVLDPTRESLPFEIEIENATFGPLDDLYRVTLVRDSMSIVGDVTRAGVG